MAQEVFQNAQTKYGAPPLHHEVSHYKSMLCKVLNGDIVFVSDGTYVITTDPIEDSDDLVMWRYCFMNTTSHLIVIISNGYQRAADRFQHIKHIFSCFNGAEFGVPFYTGKNTILFLEDGCDIDTPLDGFVNAGPCHSRTLKSIGVNLKKTKATKVITVGANDDCTLGTGINQKQTDEDGKLVSTPRVWNDFIEAITETTKQNLSVNLSRYILIPNPLLTKGLEEMANDTCMSQLVANTGMFLASRPPPRFGLRVNEGNSIINCQLLDHISYDEDYQAGLIKLQEYIDVAKSENLQPETYESAAIPIVYTHLLGGRYKIGQFGWAPGNEEDKLSVSCLTRESVSIFQCNLKKLPYFTPAYDVVAFMMLYSSL